MMSRILRKEGIEKSASEEPPQSIPFTLLFSKREKKVQTTNKSNVYDSPCFGYLDLYSSGMTIPSYLHSEMHLQNSLNQTKIQSRIVNFRPEVCAKARNGRKRANKLAPSERLKNKNRGKQQGLVQEETLVVFCTCMPRETVRTTWNEVEIRKKFFSPRASILFSTECERYRVTKKLEQCEGQSCD